MALIKENVERVNIHTLHADDVTVEGDGRDAADSGFPFRVKDGGISTNKIADDAVTPQKIVPLAPNKNVITDSSGRITTVDFVEVESTVNTEGFITGDGSTDDPVKIGDSEPNKRLGFDADGKPALFDPEVFDDAVLGVANLGVGAKVFASLFEKIIRLRSIRDGIGTTTRQDGEHIYVDAKDQNEIIRVLNEDGEVIEGRASMKVKYGGETPVLEGDASGYTLTVSNLCNLKSWRFHVNNSNNSHINGDWQLIIIFEDNSINDSPENFETAILQVTNQHSPYESYAGSKVFNGGVQLTQQQTATGIIYRANNLQNFRSEGAIITAIY